MNDTNNQQERLIDRVWLAGLWEGEGNFSIFTGGQGRMYVSTSIPNTDYVLIEKAHEALTRLGIGHYITERKLSVKNPNHSDTKIIYVCGFKRVQRLISEIRPFIRGEKHTISGLVDEYITRRLSLSKARHTSVDFDYMRRVQALNKKGPKVSSETIRQAAKAEDIVQAALN